MPTIAAVLVARIMSAFKPQRVAAADVLGRRLCWDVSTATTKRNSYGDAKLYGTHDRRLVTAQGFWLMAEASAAKSEDVAGDYNFTLQLDAIARIWRAAAAK